MSSDDFVNALQQGNNLGAEDAFKSAMQDKIGAALETKRREVANSFVKTVIKPNDEKIFLINLLNLLKNIESNNFENIFVKK